MLKALVKVRIDRVLCVLRHLLLLPSCALRPKGAQTLLLIEYRVMFVLDLAEEHSRVGLSLHLRFVRELIRWEGRVKQLLDLYLTLPHIFCILQKLLPEGFVYLCGAHVVGGDLLGCWRLGQVLRHVSVTDFA